MHARTANAIESTELMNLQLDTIKESIETFTRIGAENPEILPQLLNVIVASMDTAKKVNEMNVQELRLLSDVIATFDNTIE